MNTYKIKNIVYTFLLVLGVFVGTPTMALSLEGKDSLLFLKYKVNFSHSDSSTITLSQAQKIWTVLPDKHKRIFIAQLVESNKIEIAITLIKNNNKNDSIFYLVKLAHYIHTKNIDEAQNLLEKISDEESLKPIVLYGLTNIALIRNELETAEKYSNDKRNHPIINNLKITLLIKQGNMAEANTLFKKYYTNAQGKLTERTINYSFTQSMSTMLYIAYKNDLFAQMLNNYINPKNKNVLSNTIQLLLKEKRYQVAHNIVKPLGNSVYSSLMKSIVAGASMNNKDLHIANSILETMPKQHLHTKLLNADIASQKKDYKTALQIYKTLSPTEIKQIGWNYYFSIGALHERLGNINVAENNFEKAVVLSNQSPDIVNYLYYMRVDNNIKIKESLNMLKIAYEKSPSAHIADSVGWAYYKNKQYNEAILYLEKSSETMATDGVVNSHLGDAYEKAGRIREAIVQWKRVIDLDRANPDVNIKSIENKIRRYN